MASSLLPKVYFCTAISLSWSLQYFGRGKFCINIDMIHIKKFIDRVGAIDNTSNRDFIMPLSEARSLRDEIAKLLADKVIEKQSTTDVIEVQVNGGRF